MIILTYLQQIESFYERNDYKSVIDSFENLENPSKQIEISQEEKIQLLYYYARSLFSLNFKIKAFNVLEQFEFSINNLKPDYLKMIIILTKLYILNMNLQFKEALSLLQVWKEQFESIKFHSDHERRWYALYLHVCGAIYFENGDPQQGKAYTQKSLELKKHLQSRGFDLSQEIADGLHNLGSDAMDGELNFEEAIKLLSEANTIYNEIDNISGQAWCFLNIGFCYQNMTDYSRSIHYYIKSANYFEKINDSTIWRPLSALVLIYLRKGNFESALKWLNKLEETNTNAYAILYRKSQYFKLIGNIKEAEIILNKVFELNKNSLSNTSLILIYLNLADLKIDQNDIPKAQIYLNHSLDLYKSSNREKMADLNIKFELAKIFLRLGKVDSAVALYNEIPINAITIKEFSVKFLFLNALIEKNKPRIKDRLASLDLFKEIIESRLVDHMIYGQAIIHSVELLLLEYKVEENEKLLKEIEILLKKLYAFASPLKNSLLTIESLILQSKLAIINEKIEKSLELLDIAMEIIENQNLSFFKNKVANERNHLYEQIEMSESASLDLKRKLKIAQMENYIEQAKIALKSDSGIL